MAQVPCIGLYKHCTIPYLLGSACAMYFYPQVHGLAPVRCFSRVLNLKVMVADGIQLKYAALPETNKQLTVRT